MSSAILLELEQLQVHYGSVQALAGISLQVKRGELVSLLGSNGAGKSTCLRAISRLVPSSGGQIRWRGADLAGVRAHRPSGSGSAIAPKGAACSTARAWPSTWSWGPTTAATATASPTTLSTATRYSRVWPNAGASRPAPYRAENSRCWPSPGR